jgi:hypothetical protein
LGFYRLKSRSLLYPLLCFTRGKKDAFLPKHAGTAG